MERFGIDRVFGMHNMPGLPVGQFAIRPGPIMAATAEFAIRHGHGRPRGHAAPHRSTRSSSAARSSRRCRRSPRAPPTRSNSVVVHGDQVPWRRRLQRHPRARRAGRHGAHADARRSATAREQRMRAHLRGHRPRRIGASDRASTTSPTTPSRSTTPRRPICRRRRGGGGRRDQGRSARCRR